MTVSPILHRYAEAGAVPEPAGPEPAAADGGPADPPATATSSPATTTSTAATGRGVAWHYGDPLGEQRAATDGVVVVDRSDRAVIELPGPERLSWLHTISSQHLTALADRRSAENLSLDLNGRVEEHFVVTDLDEVTWLDTEGPRGPALLGFLQKMVFWAKVEPAARPDMSVLTLVGPAARTGRIAEILEIASDADVYTVGDLPEQHHEDEPLGFWRIMPPIGEGRALPVVDLVVPEHTVQQWWSTLVDAGAVMAGTWAFDALRVAAVRPRLGLDTDDRTIPHEVAWIGGPDEQGAVHLDKGCYRGQETVARVHNLGKAPRRLVLLHLDGSENVRPEQGSAVTAGGRRIGRVGTVVDHFELGPIALALVKRSIGPEVDLLVGDEHPVSARIDPESVVEDTAAQAGRAAIERLRSGGDATTR